MKVFFRQFILKLQIFLLITVGFFVAASGSVLQAAQDTQKHKIIAYYFHGNFRCQTCTTLERLSGEAIKEKFDKKIKSGFLSFKSVNVEQSENRHFIDDFGLYTKSLVLVDMQGDKVIRYKNLQKIWTLWRDEPDFKRYVQDELGLFIRQVEAGYRQ